MLLEGLSLTAVIFIIRRKFPMSGPWQTCFLFVTPWAVLKVLQPWRITLTGARKVGGLVMCQAMDFVQENRFWPLDSLATFIPVSVPCFKVITWVLSLPCKVMLCCWRLVDCLASVRKSWGITVCRLVLSGMRLWLMTFSPSVPSISQLRGKRLPPCLRWLKPEVSMTELSSWGPQKRMLSQRPRSRPLEQKSGLTPKMLGLELCLSEPQLWRDSRSVLCRCE